MNETFTLIWHPSEGRGRGTPVAVKMCIERGKQLNKTLIHPKLVWHATFPNEKSASTMLGRGKNLLECNLLDITRVLEVNRVDRKRYPFAQRKKSLLVHGMDGETMFFQAISEEERNYLVQGLKLIVARFASKIVVEDNTVFQEFFDVGDGVPGDAPDWARTP